MLLDTRENGKVLVRTTVQCLMEEDFVNDGIGRRLEQLEIAINNNCKVLLRVALLLPNSSKWEIF